MTNNSIVKHWEHIEYVSEEDYRRFKDLNIPLAPTVSLPCNTAVFVQCTEGSKRLEGIYDEDFGGIRKLANSNSPNRDLRLYIDALNNPKLTIIAVDGLMGTGKTCTCIRELTTRYLSKAIIPPNLDNWVLPKGSHKILIAKPHVNSGGEEYGHLPGGIDEKLDPTLTNYTQYFDRFHDAGFTMLRMAGYVKILPLGFIRGLDAKNMTIIVDEAQNTKELISVVTRKAADSRVILLGDTSPFQIDNPKVTPEKNGLADTIDLLQGAPYFQYIEMKTLEHVVRSPEVRDIVRRLFRKGGTDPRKWES